MPGPAPLAPHQLRRARAGERWRTIPRCPKVDVPPWPIDHLGADSVELEVWAELWALPPATVWREQHLERLVARLVLHRTAVECRDPSTRLLAEVRRLEEALLLSPAALARARIMVAEDEDEEPAAPTPLDRRRRLMAVDGALAKTKKPPAARKRNA